MEKDFGKWADQMSSKYGVFLEIQRGAWESRKAIQKQRPGTTPYFSEAANCFDLIKVYAAGWLREAGLAFGKNPPFAPGGAIFKRLLNDSELQFGLDDLYAAYVLSREGERFRFGRGAERQSRGQTRYLFFMVLVELIKDAILRADITDVLGSKPFWTASILKLNSSEYHETFRNLQDQAIGLIDEYMTSGGISSYSKEPTFRGDINSFLKSEQIGKNDATPVLISLIEDYKRLMRRDKSFEEIIKSLKETRQSFQGVSP